MDVLIIPFLFRYMCYSKQRVCTPCMCDYEYSYTSLPCIKAMPHGYAMQFISACTSSSCMKCSLQCVVCPSTTRDSNMFRVTLKPKSDSNCSYVYHVRVNCLASLAKVYGIILEKAQFPQRQYITSGLLTSFYDSL